MTEILAYRSNHNTMNVQTRAQSDRSLDVTVVLVSYNTAHLLENLFAALNAARGALRLQVNVIDNA